MASQRQGLSLSKRILDFLGSENIAPRAFSGMARGAVMAVGAFFSAFMIYCAVAIVPFYVHLAIFFGLTTILVLLYYPARRASVSSVTLVDGLLILMTIASVAYFILFFEEMEERAGLVMPVDVVFGLMAILVSLESCRRVLGPILPGLAVLLLAYCYFGPYFPAEMAHKGFALKRIVSFMYSMDGIMGVVTNAFANFIFLFILFGAFLSATRVGDFFIDVALAAVGHARGGAAKVAIIGSALVGSVVGSGSANVAITGVFTIPLMKKTGFKAHQAAAIEAVASTGGHIIPPIMGSVVFLMAAFTRTPYVDIVKISIIPALLFVYTLYLTADLWAARMDVRGLPRESLPDFRATLKRGWYLCVPIVILILLLGMRYSAHLSAVVTIFAMYLIAFIRSDTRLGPRRLFETLFEGARGSLVIGASAGTMGIILGGILLPGLGYKFTSLILSYSYQLLPLALVLVFFGAYILGMGMTVSGVYVVLSVLAVPALIELGVPLMAAHLTIVWFAQTSPLTPPFCLAAFIGAGIARCDPMRAGFSSVRLGYPYYIMPFLMIYTAILLDGPWPDVLRAIAGGFIGMGLLTVAIERYWLAPLPAGAVLLLFVGAAAILFGSLPLQAVGLLVTALFWLVHRKRAREGRAAG